ncbi:MAG: hypothetical protein ACLFUJ_14260 [Phycisphaerae bacterium]
MASGDLPPADCVNWPDPDKYKSLRVRMGGWSACFTYLSRAQQGHHIRRQEGQS